MNTLVDEEDMNINKTVLTFACILSEKRALQTNKCYMAFY